MPQDPSDPSLPRSDKTQALNPEILRAAQAGDPGQATVALPAGLPMLEPPPPLGDETTQALPIEPPPPDAETEAMAILLGPDATVRLPAGAPAAPADPGATVAIPIRPPQASPAATQALNADAASLSAPQPEVRTVEIPPDQLPSPKRRMPGWAWGGAAALVVGLGLGGVALFQPQWLGLSTPEPEPAPAEEAPAAPQPRAAEPPAPEIPQALRHYYDEAEKGDAAAMRMLGVMYYNGLNVTKNEAEGLKWYRKAAEHGSKAAQKELKLLEGKPAAQ